MQSLKRFQIRFNSMFDVDENECHYDDGLSRNDEEWLDRIIIGENRVKIIRVRDSIR